MTENINTPDYWNKHYSYGFYQEESELDRKMFMNFCTTVIPTKAQVFPLKICDIACGLADVCDVMRSYGHSVIANDFSETAIMASQSKYGDTGVKYLNLDVFDLAKIIRMQDFVIAFEILEHFNEADVMRLLKELYKMLKEGGMLLFSVPYDKGRHAEAPYHYTFWNYESATQRMLSVFKEVRFLNSYGREVNLKGVAVK
jgi:2-polyprenyl-3-methyl-5-hydroxy-6-metoxy-1,4-benzoquinol methylase